MNTDRKIAIIVGILFITATVASVLEYIVILPPILDATDYLVNVSANANQWIIGMLFYLINCAAVVGIAVLLFPILKKHNEALALGYVGSRIIESVILIVGSYQPTITIDIKSGICKSRSSGCFLFSNFRHFITSSK